LRLQPAGVRQADLMVARNDGPGRLLPTWTVMFAKLGQTPRYACRHNRPPILPSTRCIGLSIGRRHDQLKHFAVRPAHNALHRNRIFSGVVTPARSAKCAAKKMMTAVTAFREAE
jgi:hypothetical protein